MAQQKRPRQRFLSWALPVLSFERCVPSPRYFGFDAGADFEAGAGGIGGIGGI